MFQRKKNGHIGSIAVLSCLLILSACKKEVISNESTTDSQGKGFLQTQMPPTEKGNDSITFLGRPLSSFSSKELLSNGWQRTTLKKEKREVNSTVANSSSAIPNVYSGSLQVTDLYAMGIGQNTIFNRIPSSPVKVGCCYPGAMITFFNSDYYQIVNNSLNWPSNTSQFNYDKNWYTANCQSARLNVSNAETVQVSDQIGSETYLGAFTLDNTYGLTDATLLKSYSVAVANQLSWSVTASAKVSQKFKINLLFGETETTVELGASATGGGSATTTTTDLVTASMIVPKGKRGRIAFYKVNHNVTGTYKVPATLSGEIGVDYVHPSNYGIFGNVVRKYPASVLMGGQQYQIEKGTILYYTGDIVAYTSFF
ncbi:MAG: hypothetical protein NTW29_20275 [Bacteroidetes bacterium]|nr:hypothetical protein [Bacteroidota bacterium]